MVEKIQPVLPCNTTHNQHKHDDPHSQQKQTSQQKPVIRPAEGSPSFLEDDLLRREFSGCKFDVKI